MIGRLKQSYRRSIAVAVATLGLAALTAPAAQAEFGIEAFDGATTADFAGNPYTQAGGHPYEFSNVYRIPNRLFEGIFDQPDGDVRNLEVDLPPGYVGNPEATPTCKVNEFFTSGLYAPNCSFETQVGTAEIEVFGIIFKVPLFSIKPPSNAVPAVFGFKVLAVFAILEARVRSGSDYGISVGTRGVTQGAPIPAANIKIWGVPGDPIYDKFRCRESMGPEGCGEGNPVDIPEIPFMTMPTRCTAPGEGLEFRLRADSWQEPGKVVNASFISHLPPGYPLPPSEWGPPQGPSGCENVPFEPSFTAQPTTNAAASPSGLDVEVRIPQQGLSEPDGIAQSHLKTAEVTLPQGMTVNPSSAEGLGSCSPAQINLGSDESPSCPDAAKIGKVEVETPVLAEPLTGSVYLAEQGKNPFNSLLALYMVAEGSGVVIKLPGRVVADPVTGQLSTVFDDNPQLPFDVLRVQLKGGPRAPLMTPSSCGTHATESRMVPWSGGPAVSQQSSFTLTQGPGGAPCPNGSFDPKLTAGTASPLAGAFSPFAMKLTRADGTGEIQGITVTMPPGLSGKLAGIPYCPDSTLASISGTEGTGSSQIASPSCPAASQVASVTTSAGAGPAPLYVKSGKAYLAGPYKGAPLSLAIVTPAVAGPFDLGNVVVRTALNVNSESAQITAVSDPLPRILHGIPLSLRSVEVDIARPGFILNPTSCNPMAIGANVSSFTGAVANLQNPFQVGNCRELGFRPKLSMRVKGGTKRASYPALIAKLKARPGDANIAKAKVTLPSSFFLAQNHIRTICTRVQFAADQCPPGSVYGYAKATTPLLDQPLAGPVYLRSSSNPLPDLVAALDGQIDVDLVGRIDSPGGAIRNTFELVPDAPVTSFTLRMKGGKKGLLTNSRNLCKTTARATALFDGQNGKSADQFPLVKNDCGKKLKKFKSGKQGKEKKRG